MKIKPMEIKRFPSKKFIRHSINCTDEDPNQEVEKERKIEELDSGEIPYYTETRIIWFVEK